jgi:hypothetical protein
MSVSITAYRAAIGTWHLNSLCRRTKSEPHDLVPITIKTLLNFVLSSHGVFIGMLLIHRCGDVHPNPGPTHEIKALKICHVNVQSLYLRINAYHRRKIDEIDSILIKDHNIDIICLSETWLGNDIKDTQVDITGHEFHRKDRIENIAGGVGMYVNLSIPHRRAYEMELAEIDLLWVQLELGGKKIFIGSCYRPPGQSVEEVDQFMSHLEDSMDLIFQSMPESVFLLGDFNDSTPVWDSDHSKSELKLKLYDYINSHDLHQLILEPTYIRSTSANILDLIITDSPGYILNMNQHLLPPIGSHHQTIYAELSIQYRRDKPYLREIWNYNKGDYPGLLIDLENAPWNVGLNTFDDIDDMADYWHKTFMGICKSKIPNRLIKIRPMDKPWFNHEVKVAIRNRNRFFKRFKRTRLPMHEADWKRSVKEANFYMSKAKMDHTNKIKNLLMTTNTGEKKYWKLAKQIYGNKKILGIPSMVIANKPVSTSSEKAEAFSKFFAEQQTIPPNLLNKALPPTIFLTPERLISINTSPEEVQKILKSLDIGKANGADGISNKLLKECSSAIAKPLSDLLNKSFNIAKVPSAWKKSNICPIHKKDDRSIISNYRPIALLSCVGKVQERVVYLRIYKYLKVNKLLTWKNSGFKELDSAMNQLVFITDKIYKALEAGHEICLVFLDVSKAFDRVWHAGLLHKAKCMGITGSLLNWLGDYLTNRKIRAAINGQSGEWQPVNAGVPQGSILGPLLFLIFVNDITDSIESDIHLFADDTSLMDIMENYLQSYDKLNRDLDRLSTWASQWLVSFNATKTVYIMVSRKQTPSPKPALTLNGEPVKEVLTHKHLGLTFNTSLTWSDHISTLTTKAGRCVGLLQRICRKVPRQCLEILYKTMIRPILEYGNIIFDGSPDTYTNRLEHIQRQAALACTGAYKHTKHTTLLDELSWPLLSIRRKNHRLNVMYKVQNNLSPLYLSGACPPLTRDRTCYNLRNDMNITMPQLRTTTYQNSFFPHTIADWNQLDCKIRTLPSIDSFKENLKKTSSPKPNPLFHHDSSKAAINLTRLRLGLSALSSQRFDYKHITDPKCPTCEAPKEDLVHYFLTCPTYSTQRVNFLLDISDILYQNNVEVDFRKRRFRNFLIDTLLKGSTVFTKPENERIMNITQTYIQETHRFL